MDPNQDGWMHFLKPVKPAMVCHRLFHISGGALIDFIEFHYTAGDALSVGEGQGNEQEAFILEPGEVPTPWGSYRCINCI